jgi:hypothetical protein
VGAFAFRLPTLRTVGIAGAVAGAVALIAPFAWKAFWPAPVATIDEPAADAALAGCFAVRGRVLPSTIWQPLWLIDSADGKGWRPLARIDPAQGTWQVRTCVRGLDGDKNFLALVVTDRARDAAFAEALIPREDAIPEWLNPRKDMEQGCRGRRHGVFPIPDGAKLVASVRVDVLEGDENRCDYGMRHGPASATVVPAARLRADERKRRGRHDERRDAARVGLERPAVRGVRAERDRVRGGRAGRLVELPVAD